MFYILSSRLADRVVGRRGIPAHTEADESIGGPAKEGIGYIPLLGTDYTRH